MSHYSTKNLQLLSISTSRRWLTEVFLGPKEYVTLYNEVLESVLNTISTCSIVWADSLKYFWARGICHTWHSLNSTVGETLALLQGCYSVWREHSRLPLKRSLTIHCLISQRFCTRILHRMKCYNNMNMQVFFWELHSQKNENLIAFFKRKLWRVHPMEKAKTLLMKSWDEKCEWCNGRGSTTNRLSSFFSFEFFLLLKTLPFGIDYCYIVIYQCVSTSHISRGHPCMSNFCRSCFLMNKLHVRSW